MVIWTKFIDHFKSFIKLPLIFIFIQYKFMTYMVQNKKEIINAYVIKQKGMKF